VKQVIGQPGRIEAFEQTAIFPKIAGYVERMHVDIGDLVEGPRYNSGGKMVNSGTLLAELSVPELLAELRQKDALADQSAEEIEQSKELVEVAETGLRSAEIKVKEIEAGRARAEADVNYWQAELRRVEDLVRKKLLTDQDLDVTRFKHESAKASLKEVDAKVESAKVTVKEFAAKVRKAKADVKVSIAHHKAAQADRDHTAALVQYTKLEAPYTGVITKRNVNRGDFYQPSAGSGSKGDPLFVIARVDKVRVFVEVPETQAVWVAKDALARVRVRGLEGREFEGKVARSTWTLDPRARILRAEIDVENPKGDLRPGMYAYGYLTLEHPGVWTLPAAAVVTQGDQTCCYRVEYGKAVRMPIKVGIREGNFVEVLKKQTKPPKAVEEGTWEEFTGQEEIVLANSGAVSEGQKVVLASDE